MTNEPDTDLTNCDPAQGALIELHDTYGLSFETISTMEPFTGIPPGTLCSVYHGERRIPNKYCKQVGIPRIVKVPETHVYNPDKYALRQRQNGRPRKKRPRRIAVHTTDPVSAAKSLVNNIETETLIDVINILKERMKE